MSPKPHRCETFCLSDNQWAQVQRFHCLPDEARVAIEQTATEFRRDFSVQQTMLPPERKRRWLKRTLAQAVRLQKSAEKLDLEEPAFMLEIAAFMGRLSATISETAERSVPGPKGAALLEFVAALDRIVSRYIGRHLSRSRKRLSGGMDSREFIQLLCEFSVGCVPRGIDEAIKKIATGRRGLDCGLRRMYCGSCTPSCVHSLQDPLHRFTPITRVHNLIVISVRHNVDLRRI